MNARLKRSAIGLVSVIVAYLCYELAAVPLIEPRAQAGDRNRVTAEEIELARGDNRYFQLFADWFPDDHWTRRTPKVLENDRAMLLIKDYRPLGDGRIELTPCVIFFFPQPRRDYNVLPRDAIVLEAPQSAVLQFEDGFDLTQAKVGKLVYGKVSGPITIRSDMRQPGPSDDLLITTRDVELTDTRVWTTSEVDFRQGPNTAHGKGMEIRLLSGSDPLANRSRGLNVGGLQSFELSRQVKMNLAAVKGDLLPGGSNRGAGDEQGGQEQDPAGAAPVEVTCQGPFHFDLVNHVATFENQVDVVRLNPEGPSDQMNCELLAVHFAPKEPAEPAEPKKKQAPPPSSENKLPALEPIRIEAEGNPVVVRAPSSAAHARCQKLIYDLKTRKLEMEGDDKVLLLQGANQIHAPRLQYQPGETPDDLGTAWASGPGWLRASPDKDPSQTFEAQWNQSLHMRPHEGLHVVSLQGKPALKMAAIGQMTAGALHLWLRPAAEPGASEPSSKTQPDRLLASENVRVDSPQIDLATERLEVWFKQLEPAPGPPRTGENRPDAAGPPPLVAAQPRREAPAGPRPPASRPRPTEPAPRDPEPPAQTFAIQGNLVRLQIALRGEKADVSDVTVDGQVDFRETKTAQPDEEPLKIVGDRLQVADAHVDDTQVVVTGRPAHVEARGLTMQGSTIQLNRGANRLWIDGAGTMTLPARKEPPQSPPVAGVGAGPAGALDVEWDGKMNFDGRTARFERSVVGRGDGQLLRTERLEVELTQQVSFGKGSVDTQQVQVHRVSCQQGAWLENRSLEEGMPTSIDRLQAHTLSLNQTTGDLAAQGPGWITSVRRGGGDPLNAAGGGAAPPRGDSSQLTYLRVDFRRGIEGNTLRREVTFLDGVRAVHGPVLTWNDTLDPMQAGGLGESGMLLQCNQLTVSEMATAYRSQGTLELKAVGNTLVEGRNFTARADRLTYAQAKELLVLEGTGRSDAELWRQTYVGGPTSHAAARRILYWRSTNRVEVDDARFLDLSQIGGSQGDKKVIATPR